MNLDCAGALVERGRNIMRLFEELDVPKDKYLLRIPGHVGGHPGPPRRSRQRALPTHIIMVYRCPCVWRVHRGCSDLGRRPPCRVPSSGCTQFLFLPGISKSRISHSLGKASMESPRMWRFDATDAAQH